MTLMNAVYDMDGFHYGLCFRLIALHDYFGLHRFSYFFTSMMGLPLCIRLEVDKRDTPLCMFYYIA